MLDSVAFHVIKVCSNSEITWLLSSSFAVHDFKLSPYVTELSGMYSECQCGHASVSEVHINHKV